MWTVERNFVILWASGMRSLALSTCAFNHVAKSLRRADGGTDRSALQARASHSSLGYKPPAPKIVEMAGSPAVDHGAVSDPKLTSEGDHSVQAALEYPPLTAAYL